MAFLHDEKEDDHNHKDKKKEHGTEDRYSLSEPQKAHPLMSS